MKNNEQLQLMQHLTIAVKKRQKMEEKINQIRRDYRKKITAVNIEISEISNKIKL